ncbi:hypothetical protein [Kitasatospora sp. McL0602]|uniref:hypothetical protein n=1 Tax=Kitasatospora sp. McL0602 TaxID=3439530 RepID=UPI003F8A427A
MKTNRTRGRYLRPAVAASVAATALLAPLPAAAAAPRAAGSVEFKYDAPQISEEGDHVRWHWTVTNATDEAVHKVTLKSTLTPHLPITNVSGPCVVSQTASTVTCTWDDLRPGQSAGGDIDADLPEDLSGAVQIKGRITWQSDAQAQAQQQPKPQHP